MKRVLKALYINLRKALAAAYRYRVTSRCRAYGAGLTVNFYSTVTAATVLGNNVNFNGMAIRGAGKVLIGDNFHSGQDCLILTDNHNYASGTAIPYDNTVISKDVRIHDNVWLGDRVIILGGVTLEEGVIVQAGNVVTRSVPKYAIVGGHPAQVLKYRDREHYECLKAEGRFH